QGAACPLPKSFFCSGKTSGSELPWIIEAKRSPILRSLRIPRQTSSPPYNPSSRLSESESRSPFPFNLVLFFPDLHHVQINSINLLPP
ncbi:hypothetical protein U1Q18_037532, partial [Sarracenia purpurea var. burkii]